MNIRKATIEDIDILIKLRIDLLLVSAGNLTADEEIYNSNTVGNIFHKAY